MLKIGILGLGTVGSGVVKIIDKNGKNIRNKVNTEIKIEKILVNDLDKERNIDIDQKLLTDNIEDILDNHEIDIVVELIGGESPAYEYILKAVNKGKSVVTANKLVIAKYGQTIFKKARENGVELSYEASVAGGLPIINTLENSLSANRIEKIYGILNGTTNYILTNMGRDRKDFNKSIKKAQELGYAESDPTSDIEGYDAAYKIAILSSLAFDSFVDVDSIYVEGISSIDIDDIDYAKELGYVIKLLAIAKNKRKKIDIRVHPAFVPENHPLSMINDSYNCVYLYGDALGELMSTARGAGQLPTASAVVADIMQIGKDLSKENKSKTQKIENNLESELIDIKEVENSFYLRLKVNDKPGVMAKIASVFGDNNVSLASVLQKQENSPQVPLVFITHSVKEGNLNKSLDGIRDLEDVIEVNSVIRVEKNI